MQPNQAVSVYVACGLPLARFGNRDGKRNRSATKAGPGRLYEEGDGTRTVAQKKAGAFGRGMRNWCNGKPSKGRI